MKRLKQIGAALAAVVAIGLAVLLFTNPRVDIQIPEARAQKVIDARLPFVHDTGPVKYRVTSATITFQDSGRAQVVADIDFKAVGTTTTGRVTVSAAPYYEDGAIFLRDFHAEKTEILQSSLPPAEMDRLEAMAAKISGATREKIRSLIESGVETALQERPVYRLQPTDFKHTIARIVLSDIRVGNSRIDATLDPLGGGMRPLVFLGLVVSAVVAVALVWSIVATRRRHV
jgi:hypothetical protein